MLRDFFLGFVRIHLLYHATKRPVYGLWLIEELGRHGYKLSPGTLYPLLHSMAAEGYLRCFSQVTGGRVRKYYEATDKGREALAEIKEKIRELVEEVVEDSDTGE
jgi:DNA-binding PadR family transcriptional regulator